MAPKPVCAYRRNDVVAPAAMDHGLVDGEPSVPAVPASPVLTTTTTPAWTAAWLASEVGSVPLSGTALLPKDSLITSTSSCVTTYSIDSTKAASEVKPSSPKTLIPTSDAPGAMPRMRILQGEGSGCAALTNWLMS